MSLIMTASPWNSQDASKKRVSTMRKTIKKSSSSIAEEQEQDEESPVTTFEEDQHQNSDREERVTKLLDNMSSVLQENDGNKLADFQPIPLPDMQKKTDTESSPYGRNEEDTTSLLPLQPPKMTSETSSFSPSSRDLGKPPSMISHDPYSNYRKIYEPSRMRVQNRFEQPQISSSMVPNDKLMEKINYMIYLLEQQQTEKTSNITEEFILYTFLGIFIIFVVDSFARTGRYIR